MMWFGGAFQGELVDFYYQDALDILYADMHTAPAGWTTWSSGAINWPISVVRTIKIKGNIDLTTTTGTYPGAYGYSAVAGGFDYFPIDYRGTAAAIADGTDTGTQEEAWGSYRIANNPKMMISRFRNNVLLERYTTDGSALVRGEDNTASGAHVAFGYTPPMALPSEVDEGDQFRIYLFPQSFTLPSDVDE